MKNEGFTLSEILITLGIIGVVAAVTLPVLIDKIKDNEYDRARQKALNIVGEACKILAVQGELTQSNNAENFVKDYLSKQLKIAKTCGTNITECGFSEKINKLGNTGEITMPTVIKDLVKGGYPLERSNTIPKIKNSTGFSFVSSNGYSMLLFYNPYCLGDSNVSGHYGVDRVCVNVIYDMNGSRKPNEVGKDIGYVSVLFPDETVTAVAPRFQPKSEAYIYESPKTYASRICKGNYTLPTKNEGATVAFNNSILDFKSSECNATSTMVNENTNWMYDTAGDHVTMRHGSITGRQGIRCVKR